MLAEILAALVGPIAKLVENAISDNYDKEAELKAMLEMARAISDARMKVLLQPK